MKGDQLTTIAVISTRDNISCARVVESGLKEMGRISAVWGTKSLAPKDGQDME